MAPLRRLALLSVLHLSLVLVAGCTFPTKPAIQDKEGNFHLDLPEHWSLCSGGRVAELGKLNNGWTLNILKDDPDRNRVVGCAQDPEQVVEVSVRWTRHWLPRIFVPPEGMSPTGDNVEEIPVPSTHDGSVTADNLDQMKMDEQEWFFGILTRMAEREAARQDKDTKLVSSSHKSLPNGYLFKLVRQIPKSGFLFESKELMFLPKHDKRILALSCLVPLKVKEKYQPDLDVIETNFNSWIEGSGGGTSPAKPTSN
jgi:hypothetical protein